MLTDRPWGRLWLWHKLRLKRVGAWCSDEKFKLPDPEYVVDEDWDKTECEKVIRYLDSGYMLAKARGFPDCRICGVPIVGWELTDGSWVYPDGYVHYLKKHNVRPPEDFLEHVRANAYQMPTL